MGRPGLTTHRKFRRLARSLGSPLVARGVLETIWDACYEAGDDYLGTAEDIDHLIGWTGEPGVVALALVAAGLPEGRGFIDPIPDEKPRATRTPTAQSRASAVHAAHGDVHTVDARTLRYRVHDLWHHAPEYVMKRLKREVERRQRVRPGTPVRRTAPNGRQRPPDGVQCPPNGETPVAARSSPVQPVAVRTRAPSGAARRPPAADLPALDVPFRAFSELYPAARREGGRLVEEAYLHACDRAGGPDVLEDALRGHVASEQWRDERLIPGMRKWLIEQRWQQRLAPAKAGPGAAPAAADWREACASAGHDPPCSSAAHHELRTAIAADGCRHPGVCQTRAEHEQRARKGA